MGRLVLPLVLLTLVYALVLGSFYPADLAPGLVLSGRSGIVALPIGGRTETGVAVSALVATLSPGEVLVDVDRARGVMLVHVMDAADPEEVRRRHEEFYRRYQQRVFP